MPEKAGPEKAGADELSATLRQLRAVAGLSGLEAGRRIGWSQAKVSRYETGRMVPTPGDVVALADAYGAPDGVRRQLERLARDLREETRPPARVVMLRPERMQQRIGNIEAASRLIRSFCPTIIIGLLQTEAYARAVFSSGSDLAPDKMIAATAERLTRQALLADQTREFTLLMTEGALRWQMGGPAVMIEQLAHITDLMDRLPWVRVGVIPWTTPVTVAPMHAFDVYDERAALVGTETATAFLTDRHDVQAHAKLFRDLEAHASFGDDASDVLARVTRDYRSVR